jgi:hypothetical protein
VAVSASVMTERCPTSGRTRIDPSVLTCSISARFAAPRLRKVTHWPAKLVAYLGSTIL